MKLLRNALSSLLLLLALVLALGGCSAPQAEAKTLYIAGIPDADVSLLQTRFNGIAGYLTSETGIKTVYVPATDYAAVVTGFKQGNLQLAWYGGLTGVQARLAVPGAKAIAQRSIDESFHSVFIAQHGLNVKTLADLKGKTFTFGSESSTSGYVMPLYFLEKEGINIKRDFTSVSYSGSHDKTWKLVESGAFQAGALNASLWDTRVKGGQVDTNKIDVVLTTPAYYDYHWVIRHDVDKVYGKGASEKITKALLSINAGNSAVQKKVMDAFQDAKFIPTKNENYAQLESVARGLGIVE